VELPEEDEGFEEASFEDLTISSLDIEEEKESNGMLT